MFFKYLLCERCPERCHIMDTTDPNITFDERGWCDYCRNYYVKILPNWHPDETGEKMLAPMIEKIKKDGKGRDHDCLIGIGGGTDSSYVTYTKLRKKGGLNNELLNL